MAKNKKATINPKNINDDKCFQHAETVTLNHQIVKTIYKECQILNPKLISIIGKKEIYSHIKKTGMSLKKIIKQLLSISYMFLIILKKYGIHTNQNTT